MRDNAVLRPEWRFHQVDSGNREHPVRPPSLVEIFKPYVMVVWKGLFHQSGLAGLAGSGDHNHWVVAGQVLKSGLCVSRHVAMVVSGCSDAFTMPDNG